jgi:hypothetical protein
MYACKEPLDSRQEKKKKFLANLIDDQDLTHGVGKNGFRVLLRRTKNSANKVRRILRDH